MKPVKRIYDLGERRLIVATFYPSGIVEFREKHRRKVYAASLRHLWLKAVLIAADDLKKERKLARAAKRAAKG